MLGWFRLVGADDSYDDNDDNNNDGDDDDDGDDGNGDDNGDDNDDNDYHDYEKGVSDWFKVNKFRQSILDMLAGLVSFVYFVMFIGWLFRNRCHNRYINRFQLAIKICLCGLGSLISRRDCPA